MPSVWSGIYKFDTQLLPVFIKLTQHTVSIKCQFIRQMAAVIISLRIERKVLTRRFQLALNSKAFHGV